MKFHDILRNAIRDVGLGKPLDDLICKLLGLESGVACFGAFHEGASLNWDFRSQHFSFASCVPIVSHQRFNSSLCAKSVP